MSDAQTPQVNMPDPQKLAETMQRVAEKGQQVMQAFIDKQRQGGHEFRVLDPVVIMNTYQ
jgi:hypothetical protein